MKFVRLPGKRLLPTLWLFTDERVSETRLFSALQNIPKGSGVIFRHYSLHRKERRALFEKVHAICQRRNLLLLNGGPLIMIPGRHSGGFHRPGWLKPSQAPTHHSKAHKLLSYSAHSQSDIIRAQRHGADLLFLSPIFPTRSHPNASVIRPIRFGLMVNKHKRSQAIVALGGMTQKRFSRIQAMGAYGWAGIDALASSPHKRQP